MIRPFLLLTCLFFNLNISAQSPFNGVVNYETTYSNGRVLKTKVLFSNSAIYVYQDSLSTNDGFWNFLLKYENGSLSFYQINAELNVALVQQIHTDCSDYSMIYADSAGFGKMKVEGNPSTDKTRQGYFAAEYIYDRQYPVLNENILFKCFPLAYFMNGFLIVGSQSRLEFGNTSKRIAKTKMVQMERKKQPESLFLLPGSMQVEPYSVQRMGELTLKFTQLHQR